MAFANFGAGIYKDIVLDREADVFCIGVVHWSGGATVDSQASFRFYDFTNSVAGEETGKLGTYASGGVTTEHLVTMFFGYFANTAAGTTRFYPQQDGATGSFDELEYNIFALY